MSKATKKHRRASTIEQPSVAEQPELPPVDLSLLVVVSPDDCEFKNAYEFVRIATSPEAAQGFADGFNAGQKMSRTAAQGFAEGLTMAKTFSKGTATTADKMVNDAVAGLKAGTLPLTI
jgi:hypothetical protein